MRSLSNKPSKMTNTDPVWTETWGVYMIRFKSWNSNSEHYFYQLYTGNVLRRESGKYMSRRISGVGEQAGHWGSHERHRGARSPRARQAQEQNLPNFQGNNASLLNLTCTIFVLLLSYCKVAGKAHCRMAPSGYVPLWLSFGDRPLFLFML